MIEPRHPLTSQPKHVWVDVTGVFGPQRYPGVLLEWRQQQIAAAVKWEALVAYAVADAHSWRMETKWVLGEHVRPVP